MRCVFLAALAALSVLAPSSAFGQLSITNYQLVSSSPVSSTKSNNTYRADLVNTGGALGSVTATVTSTDPFGIRVVQGQDTLQFGPVPANSQVTSSNTFTIQVDSSAPVDFTKLQWTFQTGPAPPVANAGPNQTTTVGSTVTLDGSGSTNPSGIGMLTYSWAFASIPAGSTALLSHSSTVMPTFVVDVQGNYVITLTVSNGQASSSANVTVTTFHTPPVANAGPNQNVGVGATVVLNGSGSTSVDGRPLTYAWTLISRPAGSTATLTGANTVSPTFVADKPGTYMAQLIVNDGLPSAPSTVTITTGPVKPVANAGPNQVVNVGTVVQLDGSKSTDANGLPLTFQWSLITVPSGSAATLSNSTIVNPTFTVDRPGTYVAQLIVNDGMFSSDPATVMITTNPVLAPTANAGVNQTAIVGSTVQLSGSGTDPQNLPLTFQWTLISRPAGSAATLSSTMIPNPTFVPDLPGTYIAQLVVSNGFLSSAPSTVTISTMCSQPTANPGSNQNAIVGTTVTLDGSASGDVCHDPLTYSWTFITRPAGSTATLSGANTVTATFVPDVAGVYVVQLIVNNGVTNSNPATVSITASLGSSIVFFPPGPLNLTGAPGSKTLIISPAAGSGGQIINLVSSDPSIATVPASVLILEGTVAALVTVTPGTASGTAIITASAPGFAPGTLTVNVNLTAITIALDSSTIGLGSTINGNITLSAASPAGTVVTLSASPGGIVNIQPATVTVPAGLTGPVPFTVMGVALGATTITASSPGYASGSAGVTVGGLGQIVLPTGMMVLPGQSLPFPVSLVTGAPVGGVTIALASSDPSILTISPASVFIPFKATTPAVQPQVTGVNFGSATISASAAGFIGDSKLVVVGGAISFSPSSVAILAGNMGTLTLNLTSPAPAGGLIVNLSSSDPAKASVPATVSFAAGANSVTVPVTAIAQGLVTITATVTGLPPATATVNVVSFGQIILPVGVKVLQGQTVAFPVTLPVSAPAGGVTVMLVSSDPSKVTVTSSVFIAANTTTAQAQVTGISVGTANITASANGFTPATQAVTVPAPLSFTPGSLTIAAGTTGNLTLNLSSPAPAGGLTVNLSSSNTAAATVPASVNFAAGATSVPVPVTGVAIGSATITASASGLPSATANVTVQGALTMSFTGSPLSITVGSMGNLTLNLSSPAPAGGLTVNLSSSNTAVATVPASVNFAAGATSVPVPVTGVAVGSATITASATGLANATATVNVGAMPSINVPATTTVALGQAATFTVSLSAPAPSGGVTVNLVSSDTSKVTVPASVSIAAGATTPATQPQVTGAGIGSATVTASATGYTSGSGTVTVSAPTMSFTGSPLTLNVGATGNLTLNLTGGQAPAGGLTVNLSSSNTGVATVPATVTFAAGATSAPVPVTGVAAGSATITASAPGIANATATVNVVSDILLPMGVVLSPGQQASFPVTLTKPAPAGGVFISLSSSDTSKVTVSPANVFIPQGSTVSNQPNVTGVAVGSATITATASGLSPASAVVVVSTGGTTMSFTGPITITAGSAGNLTLNLSNPAPAGGLTVNLSSSNTAVASVPASVNFAAGATSVPVPVTGVAAGSATITASATGIPNATAGVTVTGAVGGSSSFSPGSLTITAGSAGNLTLNLSGPAPAGLTASLSSNNTGVATVPATVTFATGATSVNVPVTGVAAGSATISASTPNFGNATANVTVSPATPAIIVPASLTVAPGQTMALSLMLSSPAPPGGVFISLSSSDTSKVTVSPANVFIAEGGTGSTQPKVTGGNLGSATVTASASGFTSGSTQVLVSTGSSLTLSPSNLTIPGAATQNLTITLPAPAPPGGQTVNLSSSNTGVATVPATVTVLANATSAAVPVTGVAPGSTTIMASAPGFVSASANVTVTGSAPIILPANVTLAPGDTVSYPVSLAQPAPPGGAFINLSSSDTSKVTISPSAFFISQGLTMSITPKINGVNFGGATITASASGIGSASQQVTVTGGLNFQQGDLVITGLGTTKSLTLNLSTPAPAGGVTVNVSSNNTGVATVPSTVNFPAGLTSVNVPVTSVAPGSAVVQASSLPTYPVTAASITVVSSPTIILPSFDAVGITQSVPLPVSLSTPAPAGGVTVMLVSSDPSKFTVTPSVFIPGGAMTPATQPRITGGGDISSEGFSTVTASAPGSGYAPASLQIHVSDAITVNLPTNLSVKLGQTVPLPFALPGPAAPGGITMTITSTNQGVATVTSTAFVPGGANMPTTLPLVTGVNLGMVTIEVSGGSYTSGVQPLQVTP